MGKFIDLAGKTFGQLRVLGMAERRVGGRIAWNCVCTCGRAKVATSGYLKDGTTSSCGCQTSLRHAAHTTTHGYRDSITYRSWCSMKTRCTNKKVRGYKDYGGRGITICERWQSFENFLEDMGERPSLAHSIERRENSGNYEPGNCYWATRIVQANNTRYNVRLQHDGLDLTLAEWSRMAGIDMRTLSNRLRLGWSPAEALTMTPRYGLKRTPQRHRPDGTFTARGE